MIVEAIQVTISIPKPIQTNKKSSLKPTIMEIMEINIPPSQTIANNSLLNTPSSSSIDSKFYLKKLMQFYTTR